MDNSNWLHAVNKGRISQDGLRLRDSNMSRQVFAAPKGTIQFEPTNLQHQATVKQQPETWEPSHIWESH